MALEALAGRPTPSVPVGLFTWGFDYTWKVAGLEPWELAFGGSEAWHRAHMALYERHQPDLIWYDGAGSGSEEPTLLAETDDAWLVRDNNTAAERELHKTSLASTRPGGEPDDYYDPQTITSEADADRLIPDYSAPSEDYLSGLARLIAELGNCALVLPHSSPAYIRACYALGFKAAMEAMLDEPDFFLHVCQRYSGWDRPLMQALAAAGAEAVFIADGWASCDIISPAMFERFALPYQASITQTAHEAGLRIILWNEGDVGPILTQEASLDLDAFAWEQPRKGVDISVAQVREVFGPDRCLFGNLDSEEMLLRNIGDEIKAVVFDQIRQCGSGAPFVLSTGSPIPSNVEPAAVDAMIRAARSYSPD